MELENKNILIYGMGKSGQSAKALLLLKKANVFCIDNKDADALKIKMNNKQFLSSLDMCVVSPSISKNNKIIKILKKNNVKIITEVELGAKLSNAKIITVTGTDGKTTTVTLLNELLNKTNNLSCAVGNIGYPFTKYCQENNGTKYVVCELSSFMLEYKPNLEQFISVVLNVTSDHLDRHKRLKEYIKSKQNAIKNLSENSYCVLNYDNKITKKMKKLTKATSYFVSLKNQVKGCYVKNNNIYFNNGVKTYKIMPVNQIKLIGNHNLYNILSCLCVGFILGINSKEMVNTVKNFTALPHRTQYITSINQIEFYNDSKATTVDSCLCAVSSFNNKKIILILGGKSKNENLKKLCKQLIKKVSFIILIGETSNKIKSILNKLKFNNYIISHSLTDSVKLAYQHATQNSVILLSPACASFDMFLNFEDRGEKFIKEVEKLKKNQKNM